MGSVCESLIFRVSGVHYKVYSVSAHLVGPGANVDPRRALIGSCPRLFQHGHHLCCSRGYRRKGSPPRSSRFHRCQADPQRTGKSGPSAVSGHRELTGFCPLQQKVVVTRCELINASGSFFRAKVNIMSSDYPAISSPSGDNRNCSSESLETLGQACSDGQKSGGSRRRKWQNMAELGDYARARGSAVNSYRRPSMPTLRQARRTSFQQHCKHALLQFS